MKSSPARFFEFRLLAACALVSIGVSMSASASAVTIDSVEWVTVGNAGNTGEATGGGGSVWPVATVGAVNYDYRIAKYEVTNTQYAEFLNSVNQSVVANLGLYSTAMSDDPRGGITFNSGASAGSQYQVKSGQGQNPVIYADWYDAIRFTNWVQNGGATGSGNTEDGSYTLEGNSAVPSNAATISRNSGAEVFLPTESEWYKAAYHKNDGVTGNFWDYAQRTDVPSYSDNPNSLNTPDNSNVANVFRQTPPGMGYNNGFAVTGLGFDSGTNLLTDVGAYGLAVGPYGTFDQGGNVKEWNETMIIDGFGMHRGVSGGGWGDGSDAAEVRFFTNPVDIFNQYESIGFRLGAYALVDPGPGGGNNGQIPEPSTLLLAVAGLLALKPRRRVY